MNTAFRRGAVRRRGVRRAAAWCGLGVAAVLMTTGCASTPGSGGEAPPASAPAIGDVIGQGTVLQVGEAHPQFCLGAIMESYPPQCSGPEIVGWDWDAVEGAESASGVTWGAYAVQGTWDGEAFAVTAPPMLLALYDPPAFEDPRLDPDAAGASTEAELAAVQEELSDAGEFESLSSWTENGYLFVWVIYDDGAIQDYVDAAYGPDVVVIRSALRPLTP